MLRYTIAILLFFVSLTGFSADFIAGKDYEVLKETNQLDKVHGSVSVTEFFSFGCPWCYRIDTNLNKWVGQHGQHIYFKKIPVVFHADWKFYAKAYYAAHALSLGQKLEPAIFKAIMVDKQPLNSDQAMINFFIQQGVPAATAKSAFSYSPSIDLSVKAGQTLMARYHVISVPSFVVNNQFKTDLQMAKSEERLFAILDYLISQSK